MQLVYDDLLNAKETYLVHQVDCFGKMERGVSKRMKERYPDVFRRCEQYCEEHRLRELPGKMLLVPTEDKRIICNLFIPDSNQYGKKAVDYFVLSKALRNLEKIVPDDEAIAVPYMLGYSQDGDWEMIAMLLRDIFQKHEIVVYKDNKS